MRQRLSTPGRRPVVAVIGGTTALVSGARGLGVDVVLVHTGAEPSPRILEMADANAERAAGSVAIRVRSSA